MGGREGLFSTVFFTQFLPEERALLEQLLEEERFENGEVILKQGIKGDRLYIIDSGEIEVITTLPGNYTRRIALMGPGSFFGEVSLLTELLATATIIAIGPVVCKTLKKNALELLPHLNPTLYDTCKKYIAGICCRRVKKTFDSIFLLIDQNKMLERQVTSKFFPREEATVEEREEYKPDLSEIRDYYIFSALSDKQLLTFLSMGRAYFCEEGYDFSRHPIEEKDFFLVLSGAVQLNSDRNIKVNIVAPGKIFNQLNEVDPSIPLYPIVRESGIFLHFNASINRRLKNREPLLWRHYRDILYREIAASLYSVGRLYVRLEAEDKQLKKVRGEDV